ncbi:MAG: hypothetical protein IJK15_08425 [Bacteroidaceae bacterium]|nr:hypothetical protein [Bacteroidaceae bacterium]
METRIFLPLSGAFASAKAPFSANKHSHLSVQIDEKNGDFCTMNDEIDMINKEKWPLNYEKLRRIIEKRGKREK